jgi:methylenetetrahydrofolate--tRNA-(uracil-5-)-methyltransferase
MKEQTLSVAVVGGGLAGSEAALQLAKQGIPVRLYDMKPEKRSAAHHSNQLAEIVCSNSFGSQGEATASGLVKLEMERLGCELLRIAQRVSVPAGKALAVDRERFAEAVTDQVSQNSLINFVCADVSELPEADFILVATGPLTSPGLVKTISQLLAQDQLYFFDAASPIIVKDSINFDIAFYQDRYGLEKDEQGNLIPDYSNQSYVNCPLNREEYDALVAKIINAEKTSLKDFEQETANYFESCMPVEVIASRGWQTLRYGPMKPKGLRDPRTGRSPYAVVQLRQDNAEATLYNMVGFQTNLKWGEQKEMIQMIPGLENAEVVRYGVMHRNTYINSPEVLMPTLQLKKHPHIFFAGQLTGTEGYTESIMTGMIAALNIARLCQDKPPLILPRDTMMGGLLHYITREEAKGQNFQPINSNWGILPLLSEELQRRAGRDKKARNAYYVSRSMAALDAVIKEAGISEPMTMA